MSDLARFQRDFAAQLDSREQSRAPIQVYRNTVLLGAVDALRDNFPVTCAIVGPGRFERLAIAFARRHPPQSAVLADYGRQFPDWLESQALVRELTYLRDVAQCERLWVEALHAADAPALSAATLQSTPPDALLSMRMKLHPATRFGWHTTPAMALWLAHQQDSVDEIAPEWRCSGALFTRPELSVCGCEIDACAHRLLVGLRLGEMLGKAAEAAQMLYPDTDIGTSFAHLVQCGAFAAPNS
jgi:hypothetical protein